MPKLTGPLSLTERIMRFGFGVLTFLVILTPVVTLADSFDGYPFTSAASGTSCFAPFFYRASAR